MALIKSRPKIELRLPRELTPGSKVSAQIHLHCPTKLPVDALTVRVQGTELWYGQYGARRPLLNLMGTLMEEGELEPGDYVVPFSFKLPENLPPSYRGSAGRVIYTASIHADIPWWPDARAKFDLRVAPRPVPSPAAKGRVYSSNPQGPVGHESHVELSLAPQWTRPGDVVSGAFALSNTEHNRYTEAIVRLQCTEARQSEKHRPKSYMIRIENLDRGEAQSIPFRFQLPADAPPERSAIVGLFSVRWMLELEVKVRGGKDRKLEVPFRVLPASTDAEASVPRISPLAVGSDRFGEVWRQAGGLLGYQYEAGELKGSFADVQVTVSRSDEPGHLRAELRHSPLGLELQIQPAGLVRGTILGGMKIGHESWDRAHYVLARDELQCRAYFESLPELGESVLRSMNDEGATLAISGSGTVESEVAAIGRDARRLAEWIGQRLARVPAPSTLADPELWKTLSRRLAASLSLGCCAMRAREANGDLRVRALFESKGEVCGSLIELVLEPPVETDAIQWTADQTPDLSAHQGELRELLHAIARKAERIELLPNRISVRVPAAFGNEPPVDGATLTGAAKKMDVEAAYVVVTQVLRVAALLRGETGPYR